MEENKLECLSCQIFPAYSLSEALWGAPLWQAPSFLLNIRLNPYSLSEALWGAPLRQALSFLLNIRLTLKTFPETNTLAYSVLTSVATKRTPFYFDQHRLKFYSSLFFTFWNKLDRLPLSKMTHLAKLCKWGSFKCSAMDNLYPDLNQNYKTWVKPMKYSYLFCGVNPKIYNLFWHPILIISICYYA